MAYVISINTGEHEMTTKETRLERNERVRQSNKARLSIPSTQPFMTTQVMWGKPPADDDPSIGGREAVDAYFDGVA